MSTDIEICNLALSHLGDRGTVTSLNTSIDQTQQAALCAKFYPMARGTLLEEPWSFTTKRAALSNVVNNGSLAIGATYTILTAGSPSFAAVGATSNIAGVTFVATGVGSGLGTAQLIPDVGMTQWLYAYPLPSDFNNMLRLLPYGAPDDAGTAIAYLPRPYSIELNKNGVRMLLCNEDSPTMVYTTQVTDATKYPATVAMALSFLLASMIAGPLIKGDVGIAQGKSMLQNYALWLSKSVDSDLHNRRVLPVPSPAWIAGR